MRDEEAMAAWFHREFGTCVHPANSQAQCEAWAEQFARAGFGSVAAAKAERDAVQRAERAEAERDHWHEAALIATRKYLAARADQIGADQ